MTCSCIAIVAIARSSGRAAPKRLPKADFGALTGIRRAASPKARCRARVSAISSSGTAEPAAKMQSTSSGRAFARCRAWLIAAAERCPSGATRTGSYPSLEEAQPASSARIGALRFRASSRRSRTKKAPPSAVTRPSWSVSKGR